jgi:hypothetical protein
MHWNFLKNFVFELKNETFDSLEIRISAFIYEKIIAKRYPIKGIRGLHDVAFLLNIK